MQKMLENKAMLNCWTFLIVILDLSYLLEFFKGTKSISYLMVFYAISIIPLIIAYYYYMKHDKESSVIKYLLGYGFFVLYAFISCTSTTILVFTYILLVLIILTVTADNKLVMNIGILAIILNLALVVQSIVFNGDTRVANIGDREIQIAVLVMFVIISTIISKTSDSLNQLRYEAIKQEEEKKDVVLNEVLSIASLIQESSNAISNQIEELSQTAEATAGAMKEISMGSSQSAEAAQGQLEMTNNIQESIGIASASAQTVNSMVHTMKARIIDGIDNMEQLNHSAELVNKNNEAVLKEMELLQSKISDVIGIVAMIRGIAELTNLLALNASIEAARAGEAGKGFAVVANEINSLANQTKEATSNIEDIVTDLKDKANNAFSVISHMTEMNEEQNKTIYTTETLFQEISQNADQVALSVEEQSEQMEELRRANIGIVENIHTLSAVSEEVTANAQQTEYMVDINVAAAEKIALLIKDLKIRIDQIESLKA